MTATTSLLETTLSEEIEKAAMTCPLPPDVLKLERAERLQPTSLAHLRTSRSRKRGGLALSSTLELFQGINKRELKRLARHFTEVAVVAGTRIGRPGELCREFTVVLEGQVAIGLDGRPLGVIPPGCFFGAVSLLDENDHSRRGAPIALEPSVLAVANRQEFRSIMSDFPVVSARISEIATRRRASLDRLEVEHENTQSELLVDYPIHIAEVLVTTPVS